MVCVPLPLFLYPLASDRSFPVCLRRFAPLRIACRSASPVPKVFIYFFASHPPLHLRIPPRPAPLRLGASTVTCTRTPSIPFSICLQPYIAACCLHRFARPLSTRPTPASAWASPLTSGIRAIAVARCARVNCKSHRSRPVIGYHCRRHVKQPSQRQERPLQRRIPTGRQLKTPPPGGRT